MDRLETREVEYFVTLAEELHFGRAAERLGIAQPPLSRAIGRLERRLGVRLFERTSRRVELTAAGGVFLAESRRVLDAMDSAVRRTQRAAQRQRLVVATRPGTGPGLMARTVRAYERLAGAVPVELVFTNDQVGALHSGAADIGLMCGRGDLDGMASVEVAQESAVALLPPEHRLAGRSAVTFAELAGEDTYRELCPADTLDQIVELVSLGQLIVVAGASVVQRIGTTVVAVPVTDIPATRLVLAWPGGTRNAARALFVRTAKAAAADDGSLDRAS
ncbi:LysR family transcriptional regulator [Planotetraspora phitsanulokensis]|uniref:LysR family transcriptional regulator n=1 Tax=Planotetraspora phitsanulokensis TaxID=575192 RepID=UPI00194FA0BD|nr:LysR family transcriptional regulator [Planotetraspora phitsanulokensis]